MAAFASSPARVRESATAAGLAGLGATVAMVSHAGGEGPKVAEEIRQATGNGAGRVHAV